MNTTITFDCDVNDPECFSPNPDDPWETDFAVLVPRFTGSISAISSSLIIYIILRSKTGLSSIYHRIMFGMSLADICGSIGMALTTLPMPSYMPKEEVFGYNWAGTRLGNTYTCNAQGFFAYFGMVCMFNYNSVLCIYYACAIAFAMREKYIKRYVEPLLHGYNLLAGLAFAVPPLFYDLYNPGVTSYPWCGAFPYPYECGILDGVECIRGSPKVRETRFLLPTATILMLVTIIVPLALVIRKVIQTDWTLREIAKVYSNNGRQDLQKVFEKHYNTKAVVIQSLSYVSVVLLTGIIPPLIISLSPIGNINEADEGRRKTANMVLTNIIVVFLPLQGFFNFIIFVSHKVYNYRRVHRDVTICSVLAQLFCSSSHDPFFISRISVVRQFEADQAEKNRYYVASAEAYEVKIQDESNEDLRFRLGLMLRDVAVTPPTDADVEQQCDATKVKEEEFNENMDFRLRELVLQNVPSHQHDHVLEGAGEQRHDGDTSDNDEVMDNFRSIFPIPTKNENRPSGNHVSGKSSPRRPNRSNRHDDDQSSYDSSQWLSYPSRASSSDASQWEETDLSFSNDLVDYHHDNQMRTYYRS